MENKDEQDKQPKVPKLSSCSWSAEEAAFLS